VWIARNGSGYVETLVLLEVAQRHSSKRRDVAHATLGKLDDLLGNQTRLGSVSQFQAQRLTNLPHRFRHFLDHLRIERPAGQIRSDCHRRPALIVTFSLWYHSTIDKRRSGDTRAPSQQLLLNKFVLSVGIGHTAKGATLRKLFKLLPIAAAIAFAAAVPPAHAGDGGAVAAGIIGGLAAGTLLGVAVASPPPPPMYVSCYWAPGHPYWDGYGWVYPRVRVCQ
jgi:hypothetical protein